MVNGYESLSTENEMRILSQLYPFDCNIVHTCYSAPGDSLRSATPSVVPTPGARVVPVHPQLKTVGVSIVEEREIPVKLVCGEKFCARGDSAHLQQTDGIWHGVVRLCQMCHVPLSRRRQCSLLQCTYIASGYVYTAQGKAVY